VTREGAALPAKAGMIRVPEADWRGDSVVEGDGPFCVGGRFHPIGESSDGLTWGSKPRVVKGMIDDRLKEMGNCVFRGGSDCQATVREGVRASDGRPGRAPGFRILRVSGVGESSDQPEEAHRPLLGRLWCEIRLFAEGLNTP
jgi:hypothetical protein